MDIFETPSSDAITTSPRVLPIEDPEVSFIMGNVELNTTPEKESIEFIKSSVEDLVPIPCESEDTSGSDSECILPSCDDFSPIDIPEEKAVTFSNPLFNLNDDFIYSDNESLSDEDVLEDNEVLENIERKDSYDSNLDEPDLLVTPLSYVNEDECFDPRGNVDEINDFEDGYYDSEGDILYLKSLLSDDTTPNLPPKVFLDRDLGSLRDAPIDNLISVYSDLLWFLVDSDILVHYITNCVLWADKLDDALWTFRTAFKTPIDQAYENSLIYKERAKKLQDSKIKNRIFNVGDHDLLFNSRLKIFSGKLKTRWSGPFTITKVYPYGTAKLSHADDLNFKVNCHRLKHYYGGDVPPIVAQNPRVQNVANQNRLIGVQGNGNQNQIGNGTLVAVRVEGNAAGNNGNQIRHFARDCTARPRRRDAAYLQTQLLIAQKEEAGIQLQAE
nr:hypothetical protein [Tanacetum cinerariifolium]